MRRIANAALLSGIVGGCVIAAQAAPDFREPRGELLYSTHCTGCHNAQVHWRDARLATDLRSLRQQVRRWQNFSGLAWSDDEINAVTRHLNAIYYKFPPDERITRSRLTSTHL